jgi:NO-binding membrane sensor protein with MHYT domain
MICEYADRTSVRGRYRGGGHPRQRCGLLPRCLEGVTPVVSVHNFSYGVLNPGLAFAMSCLGSFLGLRCVILSRAYDGAAKARWLILAAVAIGAGLFIVGFGNGGLPRLLAGGAILGVGVAAMHYLGMAAMNMTGSMSYRLPLVVIAIVAGTVALWIGTWVRGVAATVGAAVVMGIAVTGMHYTGMAALQVKGGLMSSMGADGAAASVSGASAATFVVPLLLVISLATFLLTLSISLTPSEDEIRADTEIRRRLNYMERRDAADRGA